MQCEPVRLRAFALGGARAVIIGLAVTVTGCAPRNADMLHFLREHEHEVSAIEYRVGIPDSVAIHAPKVVEIDGENQQIQPDGKITLRLLGEVKIVGMTAREIAAKLEVLLSRFYVDPEVAVRVVGYASKKYYVHGECNSPGARVYTGRDTLIDAVLATGVNFLSWTSRVSVRRPAHGDAPVRTLQVNIDEMLRSGDWSKNILLEPNDIVYIPPTPSAWIAARVRDLVYPVQPVLQAYTLPATAQHAQSLYDNGTTSRGTASVPRIR